MLLGGSDPSWLRPSLFPVPDPGSPNIPLLETVGLGSKHLALFDPGSLILKHLLPWLLMAHDDRPPPACGT